MAHYSPPYPMHLTAHPTHGAQALLATARQQRERLREQEMALKQLQEALEPPGLFAKASRAPPPALSPRRHHRPPSPRAYLRTLLPTQVDADTLWRAIDAARHAGCREEALQPADKKLADITTPSWWQRAVESAPVESSGPQDGDKPVVPEASGSGGAATAAPVGAEESDKWYPGKYVGKAWNAVFNKE